MCGNKDVVEIKAFSKGECNIKYLKKWDID